MTDRKRDCYPTYDDTGRTVARLRAGLDRASFYAWEADGDRVLSVSAKGAVQTVATDVDPDNAIHIVQAHNVLPVLLAVAEAAEAMLTGSDKVTGAPAGKEPWEELVRTARDLRAALARLGGTDVEGQ